jgi:hypothetical protein
VESLGYAIACRLLLTFLIFEFEMDGRDRSPGLHSAAEGDIQYDSRIHLRGASVFSIEPKGGERSYFVALRRGCTRLTRAEECCRRIGDMWMRPYFLFLSPSRAVRIGAARRDADYSVVRGAWCGASPGIKCSLLLQHPGLVGVCDIISGVSFQISTDSSIPTFLLD